MLNRDFREFIQSLKDNEVRHLVIGGYAVAVHGHPRYTKDLDIWVEASPDNAARMIRALDQFGFGPLDLKDSDFLEPNQVIQLGYPPNRIDLLTTAQGVDFGTCFASRLEVDMGGTTVCFIDLENLKRNKQTAGRLQDLADLENLQ